MTKDGTYGAYKDLYLAGDIKIDVYMKRVTAMLLISKKKIVKVGVAEQCVSSSDEETDDNNDE